MNLTQIQRVRLRNLRELHGRPDGTGGSPKSEYLAEFLERNDVEISNSQLSSIYFEDKAIDDRLAASIEKAFELPAGWLSEDHEFLYALSVDEIAAFRELASLPVDIKASILAVAHSVAKRLASIEVQPEQELGLNFQAQNEQEA